MLHIKHRSCQPAPAFGGVKKPRLYAGLPPAGGPIDRVKRPRAGWFAGAMRYAVDGAALGPKNAACVSSLSSWVA